MCFAPPEISNSATTKNIYENSQTLATIREEYKADSIDLAYFKSLKLRKEHYFTKENRQKIRSIAKELGITKTKWLYKIIFIESGFNPKAVNYQRGDPNNSYLRVLKGRATGLIQWIPSSAIACGTTTKELYEANISTQLDYIKIYLKLALNGKKVNNFLDLYLAVFSPNAIGKSDSYIIGYKNSVIVAQNRAYMNKKDSTITKRDIKLCVVDLLL